LAYLMDVFVLVLLYSNFFIAICHIT
jgi:hypothetical protein